MSERAIELFKQAGSEAYKLCKERGHDVGAIDNIWVSIMASTLTELIVKESVKFYEDNSGYDECNNVWFPDPEDLLEHFGIK